MITVKLFKYNSPNFYINKDLVDVMTLTGVLKGETSVLDPVFEVETDTNLSQCNYVWIDEMHRYYYVTNIISVTDRLWRLTCHVDVLMTYKPQIKAHSAIISRQQNLWNLYLPDPIGYTRVSDIRLNIPDATVDEILECERLLKEGVVL